MARLGRGTGGWTRAGIAAQVAAVVLLAGAAAGLSGWLAGRPGLRARVDLTATRRNTLDPVLAAILARLPDPVTIELFLRPLPEPFRKLSLDTQARMRELLFVASHQFPEKLRVVDHDLGNLAAAGQRLQELGLQEDNVLVFLCGEQKAVLRFFQDVAKVDPGQDALRTPPRLVGFRADEALGEALLAVSRGRRPRILFAQGHGEPDPFDTSRGGLSSLQAALAADGFDVGAWDPRESPRIPEDCEVLALIAPRQPYAREELDQVAQWTGAGGRLFVVPSPDDAHLDGPLSLGELLRTLGIVVQKGIVAQMQRDAMGYVDGRPECALLYLAPDRLDPRHPVTEPLRRLAYQLANVAMSRCFSRGKPPGGGELVALASSPLDSWLDLPDAQGNYDWRQQRGAEGPGPHAIAMALEFPPQKTGAAAPELVPPEQGLAPRERALARVIVFGSSAALQDTVFRFVRDFVLNAFNWLSARDWRLNLRPRDPDVRTIDLVNTSALSNVNRVATLILPGGCALLGVLLAWRRRS